MRVKQRAPYIYHQESTRAVMVDIILALLGVYAICFYYYGQRVLYLGLACVLTCVLCDGASVLLMRRRILLNDLSPVVTGLIIPLLFPASIDFFVPVLASLFGIIVAKAAFGGTGHNVFNPAAVGFGFAVSCFPTRIFTYPAPGQATIDPLPMFPAPGDFATMPSPGFILNVGGIPAYDLEEMLLGNFPGPMGATNILVILACLLYLVFRRAIKWEIPVFFLLFCALLAFFFPRAPMDGITSIMYETMSGMLLFGGVFMIGDPVTSPGRSWCRIAYAAAVAAAVMFFRHYGRFEDSFVFVLLAMNATVWGFDMLGELAASKIRRWKRE